MKKILLILLTLASSIAASDTILKIDGMSGLTLDGGTYSSTTGNCLDVTNSSNITIKNATFNGCYLVGVNISSSSNINVTDSTFVATGGAVYAVNSSTVKVLRNKFKNVTRRPNSARGQFVQFNSVTGAGNMIQDNNGLNEAGLSAPEDLVNIHTSSGTLASPITISGNCFKGGGSSSSGGGIMLGDVGGAYQNASNNTLIDVGQYGLAAASGENINILNNKIYGKQQTFTNIGMYVWKQSPTVCNNIKVQGNAIDYTKFTGVKNGFWNAGNCTNVTTSLNDLSTSQAALTCPNVW